MSEQDIGNWLEQAEKNRSITAAVAGLEKAAGKETK